MAVTKLVERCFISDLALVSSPGVACGFRYDSNHRGRGYVYLVFLEIRHTVKLGTLNVLYMLGL